MVPRLPNREGAAQGGTGRRPHARPEARCRRRSRRL